MSEDKQLNSQTSSQLIQSRHEADRATYSKLMDLAQAVFEDPNSRLPYIPQFYRNRRNLQEQISFLETTYPKVLQARGEEICLQACNRNSNDCMSVCREFITRAFDIGNNIFSGLHKPYTFAKPTLEEEE